MALRPYPPSLFAVLDPTHPSEPSQAFEVCSLPLATHARSSGTWVAPADVHGTLGGVYGYPRNLRGPMDGPNEPSGCGMEALTDFGFLWIRTESCGSWQDFEEPLGSRVGVCGCLPSFCDERDTHF